MVLSTASGWIFEESAAPTSNDVKYTAEGEQFDYPLCCFWMNIVAKDLYVLSSNDGITADWKQVTLS